MDTSETYKKMRLAAIPDLGIGKLPEEYYSQTDNGWYSWRPDFSWEQLWLAFIMNLLYSKTWDGDSWKATTD